MENSKNVDSSYENSDYSEHEEPQPYSGKREELSPETHGVSEISSSIRMRRNTVSSLSQGIASRIEYEGTRGVKEEYEEEKDETSKQSKILKRFFTLVWELSRPYFFLDHLDWDSLKPIIRTVIQFWVAIVLIEISAVNLWLGKATYLLIIISIILASGQMSIIISLLIPTFALIGVLFAWAVSVVVLAINSRIRGFMTSQEVAQQLIEEGLCKNNAELTFCVTEQLFSGHYLSTKTTVISVIGYIFGQVVLYMAKTVNPIFIPGSIVGNIMLLIAVFYNNMIPYFSPMLLGVCILNPEINKRET